MKKLKAQGTGNGEQGLGIAVPNLRKQQPYSPFPVPRSLFPISYSLLFVFFLFVSCASAPKASFSAGDESAELSLLPAGAKLYLWADTVQARPLLDALSFEGKSGKDAGRILDSTETAAAALLNDGQDRRFFLAALGDYPRVRANFSLTFSKGWKKQKGSTGNSYWYSKNDNIALALGSNLALVSDTDPWVDFPKETPPETFREFRQATVLAGWMPNPSVALNGFLESLGVPLKIPAEELFFGVDRLPAALPAALPADKAAEADAQGNSSAASGQWELILRIRTPSASQARSLLSLFSMARFFIQRGMAGGGGDMDDLLPMSPQEAAALLFANVPEQDGEYLTLRTAPMNEDRIALLFNTFSVYSKRGNGN